MTEPIVFVSHFTVRDGALGRYRQLQEEVATSIRSGKPGTAVFVAHLDAAGARVTITHVFPNADAMDAHFEGAEQRSEAAADVMEPAGWEIYGSPSESALDAIRQAAAMSDVWLRLWPTFVAGFVRQAID